MINREDAAQHVSKELSDDDLEDITGGAKYNIWLDEASGDWYISIRGKKNNKGKRKRWSHKLNGLSSDLEYGSHENAKEELGNEILGEFGSHKSGYVANFEELYDLWRQNRSNKNWSYYGRY